MRVSLPANNWEPRHYQKPVWNYLRGGGTHAELIWHRRSGKDDIALHYAAIAAFKRPATYWHMLPQAAQARKAIWQAINPHTGIRRIDEAFPHAIRKRTREQEMQIEFLNGATWQVVGSDNYNSLVGSPPAGVVYSEWALANPSSRAYLRPIMRENGGWQVFITTPRGRNHAVKTYEAAINNPNAFAQKLTIGDTRILTPQQLREERQGYIDDWGEDQGLALFNQEWWCSFDAALLGAYYAREFALLQEQGRICSVAYDDKYPVYAAFDIGKTDDTAIWFFQVKPDGVYVIDFYKTNGKDVEHYVEVLEQKPFPVARLYLPHDAMAKRLGMTRTVEEQFHDAGKLPGRGWDVRIIPNQSVQDGIQAARKTFKTCYIDSVKCEEGMEALRMYRREWDDTRKCFRDTPLHDWTSHPADAWRYLALAWRELKPPPPKKPKMKNMQEVSLDQLWDLQPINEGGRI